MTWDRNYTWHLRQIPTIIATLRDAMVPLRALRFDRQRVTGTKDETPIPLRWEPMEDADQLWAKLVWYGNVIAQHINDPKRPAPDILQQAWTTATGDTVLSSAGGWKSDARLAQTITTWLTSRLDAIEDATAARPDIFEMESALFADVRYLLARWRITPKRLRTQPVTCAVCGEHAVRAEWVLNARGDVDQTVQCTVCRRRYDPVEVRRAADLPGSSETGAPVGANNSQVA